MTPLAPARDLHTADGQQLLHEHQRSQENT